MIQIQQTTTKNSPRRSTTADIHHILETEIYVIDF